MKKTNDSPGKSDSDFDSDETTEDRYASQYEAVSSWIRSLRNPEGTGKKGFFTATTPWIPPSVPSEFPDESHPLLRTPPSDIICSPSVPFGRPALGSQLDQALGQPSISTPQDVFGEWESTSLPNWVTMSSHGQSSKVSSKRSCRLKPGRKELLQSQELHPNDRPQSDVVMWPITSVENSLSRSERAPTRNHGLYSEKQSALGTARPLQKYMHGFGFRSEVSTLPELQDVAAPSKYSKDLASSHHFHREKKKSPEQEALMFTDENFGRSDNLASASDLTIEFSSLVENQSMHRPVENLKQSSQAFEGLERSLKSNTIPRFDRDHLPESKTHGEQEILYIDRHHKAKDEQSVAETEKVPDRFLHIFPKNSLPIQRHAHQSCEVFNLDTAVTQGGEPMKDHHDQLHLQTSVSYEASKTEIQIPSSEQMKINYMSNNKNEQKRLQSEFGTTVVDENTYSYEPFDLSRSSLLNGKKDRAEMVLPSTDNRSTLNTNPKTLNSETKFALCHQGVQTASLNRGDCKIKFDSISNCTHFCHCLLPKCLCDAYLHPHHINQRQDITDLSFFHQNQKFLLRAEDPETSRLHQCPNVKTQNSVPPTCSENYLLTPNHLLDPHLSRPTEIALGFTDNREIQIRASKPKRKSSPLGFSDRIHHSVSRDEGKEQEKRLCIRKQLRGGPDPDILRSRILLASYNEIQSAVCKPSRKRMRINPFADVLTPLELKSIACNRSAEPLTPKPTLEEGHISRGSQLTVTQSSNRGLLLEENNEFQHKCTCQVNVIATKPGEGLAKLSRRKLWPSCITVDFPNTCHDTHSLPRMEKPFESQESASMHTNFAPPANVRADDRSSEVEEKSKSSIETQRPPSLESCNIATEDANLNEPRSSGIFSQASDHRAGFKSDRCEPKAEMSRKRPVESFHSQHGTTSPLTDQSGKSISFVARLLEIASESKHTQNTILPAPSPSACFSPRSLSVVNDEQGSIKGIFEKEKYHYNDDDDPLMLDMTVTKKMPASIEDAGALRVEENASISKEFGYNQESCSKSGKQNAFRQDSKTTTFNQRIEDKSNSESEGDASRVIKGFHGNNASPNLRRGDFALQGRSKSSDDVQFSGTALCSTKRSCIGKEHIHQETTLSMEISLSPGDVGYSPPPSKSSMHMHAHEKKRKSDARIFFSNLIPKLELFDTATESTVPKRIAVQRSKCSRLNTATDTSRRRQRCLDRLKTSRIPIGPPQKIAKVNSTIPAEISKSVRRCMLTVPRTKKENIMRTSSYTQTDKTQRAKAASNPQRPKVVNFIDYPQHIEPLTRKAQSPRKPSLPESAGSYLENFLLRPCVKDKQLHENADQHPQREDYVIKSDRDQISRSLKSRIRSSLAKSSDASSEHSEAAHGNAKCTGKRVQLHSSSSVSIVQQGIRKPGSESIITYHDVGVTTPTNYDFNMARKQSEYMQSRECTCGKLDTHCRTFGATTKSRPAAGSQHFGINTTLKRTPKLRSRRQSMQIDEEEHKLQHQNESCYTTEKSFWLALHKQRLQKSSSIAKLEHCDHDSTMVLAHEYQALTELMDIVFQSVEDTTKSSALPQSNYRSREVNFEHIGSTTQESTRTMVSGISRSRSESPSNSTKAKRSLKMTPAQSIELGSKSGLQNGQSSSFSAKNMAQRSQPMIKGIRQSPKKRERETHAALVAEADVRFDIKSSKSMQTVVKIRSLTTKKTITTLKPKPKRSISKTSAIAEKELKSVVLPLDPRASSRYGYSFGKEFVKTNRVTDRRKPLLDQSLPRSFASINPIAPPRRQKYYSRPPWCKFYKIKGNQLGGGLNLQSNAGKEENVQNPTPRVPVNTVPPPLRPRHLRTLQPTKTEKRLNMITSPQERRVRPGSVRLFSIPFRRHSSWFPSSRSLQPHANPAIKGLEILKALWKMGPIKSENFDGITAEQEMLAVGKNAFMLEPNQSEKERNFKGVFENSTVRSDAFSQAHHLHSVVVSSIRAVQWHGLEQENRGILKQDKMTQSIGAPTPISVLQPSQLYSLTFFTVGTFNPFFTIRIPNLIQYIHTSVLFPEYSTRLKSDDSMIGPLLGNDWADYDDLWKMQLSPSMMTACKVKPSLWEKFPEGVDLIQIISRDHRVCPAFRDVSNNDNRSGNFDPGKFPSYFCDHEEDSASCYSQPKFNTPFRDSSFSNSDLGEETTSISRQYSWIPSISIEFSYGIPITSGLEEGDYELTKDQNSEPLHCTDNRLRSCYNSPPTDASACAADVCHSLLQTSAGCEESMTFAGCAAAQSCTFQWLLPISRLKVFTNAWLEIDSRVKVVKSVGSNFKVANTLARLDIPLIPWSVFRPLVMHSDDGYWTSHPGNNANIGSKVHDDQPVSNVQSQVAKGGVSNQPPTAAENSTECELLVKSRELHRAADFLLSSKRKRRRMKPKFWYKSNILFNALEWNL